MLSRIFSALLVVLIVSPFSAPFSTCGMATLIRSGREQLSQPNVMAMDLHGARDIGNTALVPRRPNMRTNIVQQLCSLLQDKQETAAAVRFAKTVFYGAEQRISSPLRI